MPRESPRSSSASIDSWEQFGTLRRHVVDIELTNRCNARCDFCPRDVTPQQGLMTLAIFELALARVVEFRDAVLASTSAPVETSFCGLGEQLLNPRAADFVDRMRAVGIPPVLTTNGALLTEDRARALLDSGLAKIFINAGEVDEDYERTYHVAFERTRRNTLRFLELADGRCEVWVVLVDHRRDPAHVRAVETYWRALGVRHFFPLPLQNRAGSLPVADMQYEAHPHVPEARARLAALATPSFCPAPFAFPFIGWDGRYYLCGSDWRKEVAVGHVDTHSLLDIIAPKLQHVVTRDPICGKCPHDPVNRLADALRATEDTAANAGDVGRLVDDMAAAFRAVLPVLSLLDPRLAATSPAMNLRSGAA